jgi:lipase chaperone LimK
MTETGLGRRCSRASWLACALTAALAAAGAAHWLAGLPHPERGPRADPVVPASAPPPADVAAGRAQPEPAAASQPQPPVPPGSLAPLPAFLRGIPVDGELAVDARGHFRPSLGARHLFQHFFLAAGLEPDDVIRGRIALEIAKRLPSPAAQEALAALDRFVALREQLQSITWEEESRRRFERLRELRRSALGPELAEAFYGEDERTIAVELELQEIRADASLSPEQRAQRSEAAERELPPRVREARASARAPLRVQAEVERLRAQGASPQEIFALREREFGSDAAERLAALDAERERWQQAWSAYRAERDRLLRDAAALAPAEREARLEALRRERFAERELARVRAQDRADGASARMPAPGAAIPTR